jgi:hypothetical protein
MFGSPRRRIRALFLSAILLGSLTAEAVSGASWNGVLLDSSGKPVAEAVVKLHPTGGGRDYTATSSANGKFAFVDIAAGLYELSAALRSGIAEALSWGPWNSGQNSSTSSTS